MAPPPKAAMKQGNLFSFFSKKEPKAPPATKESVSTQSTAPPTTHAASVRPAKSPTALSHVKVGLTIEVYWSQDDAWYKANVTKHRGSSSTRYYLEYLEDGQCEWIDLSTERFRIVDAKQPATKKRSRVQLQDTDEEAEFDMPDDEEYKQDDKNEDDDDDNDDNDQWMVSDDEVVTTSKSKKRRASAGSTSTSSRTSDKTPKRSRPSSAAPASSLSAFAAGTRSDATQSGTQTPASARTVVTPGTGLSRGSNAGGPQQSPLAQVALAAHPTRPSTTQSVAATPFVQGALNPAGSHVHNHLAFLQHPVDAQGRSPDHADYDPRTLRVRHAEWDKVTRKSMTDAVKQWWDLKSMYFDTVLLFKTGKFYEMFHTDADIGVQVCGLTYMKGHVAHAGFPEISYGPMSDALVRAGYKVARVEQTETPDQLNERKKMRKSGPAPKVVNREVCSIVTLGTRTFCYLDDASCMEGDEAQASTGPLLAIREIPIDCSSSDDTPDETNVQPVCEYGVTLVDAIRGSVTIGQFADDVLRSRLTTLLTSFTPSEILLEGGEDGASPTLRSLIRAFQTSTASRIRIETIRPNESFPQSTALDPNIRSELERGDKNVVHPWDVKETLAEVHRRKYYPRASKQNTDEASNIARWPRVLKAAIEGNAELALSSFGAALYYLQRHLIDAELLSMGIVKAYIPPESASSSTTVTDEMQQLAVEQNMQESGVADSEAAPLPIEMDQPALFDVENEVTCMSLDGTTLHNLEILTNTIDHKATGSLWSKINYTKTPHGSRLLRAWLLRPLFRKADIERRQDAVEELVSGGAAVALKEARSVLAKCGDIERLLSRIHSMSGRTSMSGDDDDGSRFHPNDRAVLYETATYTKRKVGDFSKVLNGLRQASQIPELFDGIEIQSPLLRKIVHFVENDGCFPNLGEDLDFYFSDFNCERASQGKFEPSKGVDPEYDQACDAEHNIIAALNDYKDEMCTHFLTPRSHAKNSWKYVNIKPDSKDKYLIELPSSVDVPDDFVLKGKRGSGQKQVNKYRTQAVEKLVEELEKAFDIQKERKAMGLELIFSRFDKQRDLWAAAAQATALLDALGSLAQTAAKPGYTRPKILDCQRNEPPVIKVIQGRHPCVEKTFSSAGFVPNDLVLGSSLPSDTSAPRVLLLSGPNMGGKSTLLRQTCLVAILAQMGSFVPAEDCELTPVDRIFTRLGASDRILLNQSTFFVELAETAAALRGASSRSLVIMDELGRGTSTFDGTAIASAAVQHLVERNKCLTLFATHYHSLLDEWKESRKVALGHMECLVEEAGDEGDDSNITFLYTLGNGICPKSFAINVARLAGLPKDVLVKAKRISAEFELEVSSAEASRSLVTAHTAIQQQRAITEAIAAGSWDEVQSLWQGLQ